MGAGTEPSSDTVDTVQGSAYTVGRPDEEAPRSSCAGHDSRSRGDRWPSRHLRQETEEGRGESAQRVRSIASTTQRAGPQPYDSLAQGIFFTLNSDIDEGHIFLYTVLTNIFNCSQSTVTRYLLHHAAIV